MCRFRCESAHSGGQMYRHAQEYHTGKTVYLNLNTGRVILLSSPVGFLADQGFYYGNLGQNFETSSDLPWSIYRLNQKQSARLEQALRTRTLNQLVY